MSTQHTPGPWKAHADLLVRTEDGWVIARCCATLGKYELEKPNARLVAAAPELLAALQVFTMFPLADMRSLGADEPYTITMLGRHMHEAIDAIIKATGAES